jgi:hypothetical protein
MASIVSLLASLPEPIVRKLSDELQGAMQQSAVDNPFAYLRKLIELHRTGTLTLEHAPRIQAERERRQRCETAAPPPSASAIPRTREPSMPPNWRAGLKIPPAASQR